MLIKKHQLEDAKFKERDRAINMMIMSEEEFKQIYNYIENPDKCKKGDKFAQKYALVVCNATYKDKVGL